MGIAPYKTFTFDGVSSDTYGVYLTGEGVFNAPERSVEMIQIAGRNGDYALDLGKFNNITVTYKAGMYDVNESNFATKVANLRNWLCSKVGYCRLSDDYNPNEYRMGVYASGLKVDHEMLIAGEFELTFECKPQRFLTSGETATTVANNGTLTNPTNFEAEPLLAVKGYGDVRFNGYTINLQNVQIGTTLLASSGISSTVALDMDSMNTGDSFTVSGAVLQRLFLPETSAYTVRVNTVGAGTNCTVTKSSSHALAVRPNDKTFAKGTSSSLSFSVASSTIRVTKVADGTNTDTSVTLSGSVAYDGDSTLTFSLSVSPSSITNVQITQKTSTPDIYGTSTMSALGNPTYIDCSIGECYMIKNSKIISLNSLISLGSDLPKLSTGTNTFTKDNTITELKVTPNWWQV